MKLERRPEKWLPSGSLFSSRAEQRRALSRRDSHASVKDDRASLANHERIAIQFGNLWKVFSHTAHSQEAVFKRGGVAHGASSSSG